MITTTKNVRYNLVLDGIVVYKGYIIVELLLAILILGGVLRLIVDVFKLVSR